MKQKNAKRTAANTSARSNTGGNNSNRNNSRNNTSNKNTAVAVDASFISKWWFIPVVFAIAVIPLIVVIHTYDSGLQTENWFSIGGTVYDFFLYYKTFFLRLIGIIVLFILAYMLAKKDRSFLTEKRNLPPLIAIGIFGLFSLASAIFSAHADTAFWGGYEQWEGWFVILAYVACFFMGFGYARTVDLVRFLLNALLIGATIVGILGVFQAMGLDWIQSDWAKPIIAAEYAKNNDMTNFNVKLNFGEGMAYVTLYNPNYVGSYVALVLPYMFYLIVKGEKIWRRILAAITSVTLIVTLLASQSKTGILGLAAGAFILGVLLLPYLKKARIVLIACMALSIILPVGYIVVRTDMLSNVFGQKIINTIEAMENKDNSIKITLSDGRSINAMLDAESIKDPAWARNHTIDQLFGMTDESGAPLNVVYENGLATLTQDGYPSISFIFEARPVSEGQTGDIVNGEISLLHVAENGNYWTFTAVDGEIKYFTDLNKIDDIRKIKGVGFDGYWEFASRRGYIWSKTNPILAKTLFLGVGRDNFTYAFPNDDYVGKKYVEYSGQTITKPHDMFLQIWTQDGLPALIAFVFLYILLLIRVIRLCYKKVPAGSGITMLSFAVITVVAATGYIVVGVANDSTITVAPVYWCMLGVGYAAEAVCQKQL